MSYRLCIKKNGENIRQGKGQLISPNGLKYEGWFHNNKQHGKGRIIYENRDSYEG